MINEDSHFHIFWNCQVVMPYWQEIHKLIYLELTFLLDVILLIWVPFNLKGGLLTTRNWHNYTCCHENVAEISATHN